MEDPFLETERVVTRTLLTPKQRKAFAPVLLVLTLVIGWYVSTRQAPTPPVVPVAAATSTNIGATTSTVPTNAFVVRAVDGDTLDVKLDGETAEVKVRLLGVNTPESVDPRRPVLCFGKEASHFTASSTAGQRVQLVADPQADERDKYNRLLRNVVLADGTDFNAQLVREGYAYAYVSFPMDKLRKAELTRLQKEAEAEKRGLWNPETCNGAK